MDMDRRSVFCLSKLRPLPPIFLGVAVVSIPLFVPPVSFVLTVI